MKRTMIAMAVLLALCAACAAETFLVTSDLHLTGDRATHEAALDALRKAAEGADAVILLGDSTNNTHPEEHAYVKDFLLSLGRPAYVIPGNHDVTRDISEFTGLYADYGWNAAFSRDAGSASCAVMTAGGTCLLLLDTNDIASYVSPRGGISDATCVWVRQTLSSLPDGTPVVACGHHPILPATREQQTPGAVELAKALGGTKLYLCGHDHGFAAVKVAGLQQITVGQPHAYPCWAGVLAVTENEFRWRVLPLFDAADRQRMRADALRLADGMARGTLKGTVHEGDEEAIQWFVEAFEAVIASQLTPQRCAELLDAPAALKWRQIETKTVVKAWILGLLESCPQDVRRIDM